MIKGYCTFHKGKRFFFSFNGKIVCWRKRLEDLIIEQDKHRAQYDK